MRRSLVIAPLIIALSLPLAGCGQVFTTDDAGMANSSPAQTTPRPAMGGVQGFEGADGAKAQADPAAPAQAPSQLPAQDKYVIKTASLSLQVEDVEGKLEAARKVIAAHKGEVSFSSSRVRDREVTSSSSLSSPSMNREPGIMPPDYYPPYVVGDYAMVQLEVPAEELEALLKDLRTVGKVVTDTTTAQDATLEVLGLDAQIASTSKSLEGLEKLLLTAKSVDETLKVEQAITARRSELAGLQAQQNSLKTRAAKSSVTLQLLTDKGVTVDPGEKNWFEKTWDKISGTSSDVVALLALVVLFFAPLILLIMLAINLFRRFLPAKRRPMVTPAGSAPSGAVPEGKAVVVEGNAPESGPEKDG